MFRRVLAIDDDAALVRAYRLGFGRGVDVLGAATRAEALAIARAEQPDLVLVDLRLGEEWGGALVRPLRLALPEATIVVVSAFVSVQVAVASMRGGADHVLQKPVCPRDILNELWAAEPDEASTPGFPSLVTVEWDHILRALDASDGNISRAARLLGIRRTSLQRKLRARAAR